MSDVKVNTTNLYNRHARENVISLVAEYPDRMDPENAFSVEATIKFIGDQGSVTFDFGDYFHDYSGIEDRDTRVAYCTQDINDAEAGLEAIDRLHAAVTEFRAQARAVLGLRLDALRSSV